MLTSGSFCTRALQENRRHVGSYTRACGERSFLIEIISKPVALNPNQPNLKPSNLALPAYVQRKVLLADVLQGDGLRLLQNSQQPARNFVLQGP